MSKSAAQIQILYAPILVKQTAPSETRPIIGSSLRIGKDKEKNFPVLTLISKQRRSPDAAPATTAGCPMVSLETYCLVTARSRVTINCYCAPHLHV